MKRGFGLFAKMKPRQGTLQPPSTDGQRYCPNCHYPLPEYAAFCANCGQKYTDGRVKLSELLADFWESVLNIDSRVFRTITAMFVPGKLTNEYFKGRQKRYLTPGRFFFVMAVIHFAVLGFLMNTHWNEGNDGIDSVSIRLKRNAFQAPVYDQLDSARARVEKEFRGEPRVSQAMDSLMKWAGPQNPEQDSIGLIQFYSDKEVLTFRDSIVRVAVTDLISLSGDELADKYHVEKGIRRIQFRQIAKLNQDPGSFIRFAFGKLVWMVVLMMPALAFILKLLYIRRRRFFVEHLVFSFHYHAFAFFVVSLGLLFLNLFWTDLLQGKAPEGLVFPLVFGGIAVYLFIAMRRVYQQGFFKTFIKYTFLNFAYLLIFILFLGLTFVASGLMY